MSFVIYNTPTPSEKKGQAPLEGVLLVIKSFQRVFFLLLLKGCKGLSYRQKGCKSIYSVTLLHPGETTRKHPVKGCEASLTPLQLKENHMKTPFYWVFYPF